ncbi:hypothetical protein MRX96_043509 [Rhipicephalus microplus]
MMSSIEIVLFLLALLMGLMLRRAAQVPEIGVIEQLERKINSLENKKRKLKRQLADFRARAGKSETRLLEDTSATREGQMYVDLDKDPSDLEDASHELEACAHNHEEAVRLLHFCRSTILENLSSAIDLAERRNAAVSKLYFDVFGQTNGKVQLLSQLTDPWRRWAELLALQRDRAECVFTRCLERASRHKKIEVEDLPPSAGFKLSWQEPDYGFDRILNLVRTRLSSRISRSESVADFDYLRSSSNSKTNCFGTVRKSGYLRLARTLHKRMPDVPEERLVACLEMLRSQNGGLTGLRVSEIREEVSRLIHEWPSSAVR